ncbi:MAG: polyphosphate kinase 1 [Spirochaetes bacterium]|nr:polyphosphate kinase 1 [Spirochaetota bacterium]
MNPQSKKYINNRELSWLEFNYRVLEEALDQKVPLLERMKFLAIFASNLDEFFMVRVAGLVSQVDSDYKQKFPSGLLTEEVLIKLEKRMKELNQELYACYHQDIYKKLSKENLFIYHADTLPEIYEHQLEEQFLNKYFLITTPLAIDQARPFPFLINKNLNLLVQLLDPKNQTKKMVIIPIPKEKRLIEISNQATKTEWILLEELIKKFAHHFFKGYEILDTMLFRITRDAELAIDEEETADLLLAIQDELKKRERGRAIRLEMEADSSQELKEFLYDNINFYSGFDFEVQRILDFTVFFELPGVGGLDRLKYEPLEPVMKAEFTNENISIFDIIKESDRLIHHPYESFLPVIRFIDEAANDPKVLAIKQTLYRTSGESPIIKSLKRAAEQGKQVTVLVELKARFDEAQNINWAKQLEQAGCHVVYGLVGLKTHSKIALVVRDEPEGICRYLHLSTGNYNDKTAQIYTDIGLFTSNKTFGQDASAIFNVLTGYSVPPRWKKLITAPLDLRDFFLKKINHEKENARNGLKAKIQAKMNSLIDIKIIEALYEASQAGVKIELIVRGMTRILPGIKGLSDNISLISIVDRFLEHSRIFYFYNNGEEDIYLGSADWMERNFDRRIEIIFPVEEYSLKSEIKEIFKLSLDDNQRSRILKSDGTYSRRKAKSKQHRSQYETYQYYLAKNKISKEKNKKKFIPKTRPDEI